MNNDLNFCPTFNRYNKKQFKNKTVTLIRKVKLKTHFKNKKQEIENREFRISSNKSWKPKENQDTVETFTQAFQNDLSMEEEILNKSHSKICWKKKKTHCKIYAKWDDTIITKADKGGAVRRSWSTIKQ